MTVAWVLGSGGLLGTAICRKLNQLETFVFHPDEHFTWHSEEDLATQFAKATRAFADIVANATRWEIYWAAGRGTMGSPEEDMLQETRIFSHFLQLLKTEPIFKAKPGKFAFASSAGGIYAGTCNYVINEETPPAPTTPYAREKLRQEKLLETFSEQGNIVLLARISTLYGRGQSAKKKQGLITHMARCVLKRQIIHIYVPFDTIRDYITVDDAAVEMIFTLRFTSQTRNSFVKIVASEQPTTIAQIISVFKVITRRSPLIVSGTNKLGNLYPRCVQFRSIVEPRSGRHAKTNLLTGISQVVASERKILTLCRN